MDCDGCKRERHHLVAERPLSRNLMPKVNSTARKWGQLAGENPALGVGLPEKTFIREKRMLAPDQIPRLLARLAEPVRTIGQLALWTGLRVGESVASAPCPYLALRSNRLCDCDLSARKPRRWYSQIGGAGPMATPTCCAGIWSPPAGASAPPAKLARLAANARYVASKGRRIAAGCAGAIGSREDFHHVRSLHAAAAQFAAGSGRKPCPIDGE